MNRSNINISKIESYLYSIINNKVSENTFSGTLPANIDSTWNDMVLIDCSNDISDMDAYGRGTILIFLYAKPLANGVKNVKVMSSLEQLLDTAINNANDKTFVINKRFCYQGFNRECQWHWNAVELNIQIF